MASRIRPLKARFKTYSTSFSSDPLNSSPHTYSWGLRSKQRNGAGHSEGGPKQRCKGTGAWEGGRQRCTPCGHVPSLTSRVQHGSSYVNGSAMSVVNAEAVENAGHRLHICPHAGPQPRRVGLPQAIPEGQSEAAQAHTRTHAHTHTHAGTNRKDDRDR